jgi:hypothetical protein
LCFNTHDKYVAKNYVIEFAYALTEPNYDELNSKKEEEDHSRLNLYEAIVMKPETTVVEVEEEEEEKKESSFLGKKRESINATEQNNDYSKNKAKKNRTKRTEDKNISNAPKEIKKKEVHDSITERHNYSAGQSPIVGYKPSREISLGVLSQKKRSEQSLDIAQTAPSSMVDPQTTRNIEPRAPSQILEPQHPQNISENQEQNHGDHDDPHSDLVHMHASMFMRIGQLIQETTLSIRTLRMHRRLLRFLRMLALQRLEVLLQEPSSDASTTAGDEEEK